MISFYNKILNKQNQYKLNHNHNISHNIINNNHHNISSNNIINNHHCKKYNKNK